MNLYLLLMNGIKPFGNGEMWYLVGVFDSVEKLDLAKMRARESVVQSDLFHENETETHDGVEFRVIPVDLNSYHDVVDNINYYATNLLVGGVMLE